MGILRAVDLVAHHAYSAQRAAAVPIRTTNNERAMAGRRVRHPYQLHDAEGQRTGKRTTRNALMPMAPTKTPTVADAM